MIDVSASCVLGLCAVDTLSSELLDALPEGQTCNQRISPSRFDVSTFHVQAPGFHGKSRADTAGPSGTIAIGTSASSGYHGPGSHGVPRIPLTNAASILCTPPSLFSVLALITPSRVPVTTSSERSCTPKTGPCIQRSSRRDRTSPSQRKVASSFGQACPQTLSKPRRLLDIIEPALRTNHGRTRLAESNTTPCNCSTALNHRTTRVGSFAAPRTSLLGVLHHNSLSRCRLHTS